MAVGADVGVKRAKKGVRFASALAISSRVRHVQFVVFAC